MAWTGGGGRVAERYGNLLYNKLGQLGHRALGLGLALVDGGFCRPCASLELSLLTTTSNQPSTTTGESITITLTPNINR